MYTLGIDIGSTTSKCAVLKDGKELVAHSLQTGGLGTGGPEEALAQLWQTSGLTRADMACAFVTGYGRKNYEGADGEISELTAHALGGRFVFPDLRTVIDIGGQDAKVIALSPSGKMVNFVMNDKCAAGTGRFLDVMASILRLDVDDLDAEAAKAAAPAAISSTCTVFAESEVITLVGEGKPMDEIAAGIQMAVAKRCFVMSKKAGATDAITLTGGCAKNAGLKQAIEHVLKLKVIDLKTDPQLMGALGAAEYARQKGMARV